MPRTKRTARKRSNKAKRSKRSIRPLLKIMAHLRSPSGCPWDREQDHESIKQCVIEEAYEVVEAIESGRYETLRDELGDLLLQVVFHAQLASERRWFDFYDVVDSICEKLVRRHPHVFGTNRLKSSDAVLVQWEKIKLEERKKSGLDHKSALDGVPKHLPALMRAEKLQKKAAKAGLTKLNFKNDWRQVETLLSAIKTDVPPRVGGKVLGEVLFTVVALARAFDLEPEQLLRAANARFEREVRKREATGTR